MWQRRKVRVNWHQELRNDSIAITYGFTSRLFRQSTVYRDSLSFWDYPARTVARSWKHQSKNRKQWEH